jgi:hypothetical protein
VAFHLPNDAKSSLQLLAQNTCPRDFELGPLLQFFLHLVGKHLQSINCSKAKEQTGI